MRYGYNSDGLNSDHNSDFMDDYKFNEACERGKLSLEYSGVKMDFNFQWRVYIALWCAKKCSTMKGDFAEFGVAGGFISSSICKYLDWNLLDKNFYLLDTFSGIDKSQLTDEEKLLGGNGIKNYDKIDFDKLIENFSEWKNIKLIKGIIPHTLNQIDSKEFCFYHIDLNCAEPEKRVFLEMYDKLISGGIILLDDYGYNGYYPQKKMWDGLSKDFNFNILSLPTGQGLIIK